MSNEDEPKAARAPGRRQELPSLDNKNPILREHVLRQRKVLDGLKLDLSRSASPPGETNSRPRPWNWVWFGPVLLLSVWLTESHTVRYAWAVSKLAWSRWEWWALISPSAAFCWSVALASVFTPMAIAAAATSSMFDAKAHNRSRALVLIVVLVFVPFVTDFLIWGSFPFTFDNEGTGHLRLIPFLPWPDTPYGVL